MWLYAVSNKTIVSGGPEGAITWDLPSKSIICRFGTDCWCACPVPGTTNIVLGGLNGSVVLWDYRKGISVATLQGAEETIYCVAVSDDGRWIAAGNGMDVDQRNPPYPDPTIWIWDAKAINNLPRRILGHQGTIGRLAFAGNDVLISISADNTIRKWDVGAASQIGIDGTPRPNFYGGSRAVLHQSLAIAPDKESFILGGILLDVSTLASVRRFPKEDTTAWMFLASPNRIAYGTNLGLAGVCDGDGKEIWSRQVKVNKAPVTCLAYLAASNELVTAGEAVTPALAALQWNVPMRDVTIKVWQLPE